MSDPSFCFASTATASSSVFVRARIATRAPSSAHRSAIARPMPRPAGPRRMSAEQRGRRRGRGRRKQPPKAVKHIWPLARFAWSGCVAGSCWILTSTSHEHTAALQTPRHREARGKSSDTGGRSCQCAQDHRGDQPAPRVSHTPLYPRGLSSAWKTGRKKIFRTSIFQTYMKVAYFPAPPQPSRAG